MSVGYASDVRDSRMVRRFGTWMVRYMIKAATWRTIARRYR